VITGTVCTSGFLVIVVYYWFGKVIVLFVGNIGFCGIGYWGVIVCCFNVCSCFY
jgi:hypothetical protein